MITARNCTLAVLILCCAADAFATEKQTRKIVGWSDANMLVLVETSGTIDDPESKHANKSYFFESHEKIAAGKVISVHPTGTCEGPVPVKMKPTGPSIKPNLPAVKKWSTPDQTAHIARITSEEIKTKKKSFCELTEQFVLIDQRSKTVLPLQRFVTKGDKGSASKVKCVRPAIDVAWSEDGTTFGIVRQVGKSVDYMSDKRANGIDKRLGSVATNNPLLSTGRLKDSVTWRHLIFRTPVEPESEDIPLTDAFGNLLILSQELKPATQKKEIKRRRKEVKEIRKRADKLFRKSDKSTWFWGLRAAVYRSTGETKLTKKYLDKGIAKATSYQDLAELGYLFYEFDLDIAAQLLVHALSHPSAKDKVAHIAYSVLIRTLVESGNLGAATQLVEKFSTENTDAKELSPDVQLEIARYETQRRVKDAHPHVSKLMMDHPTLCDGYTLLGRSVAGKNPRQALNLFRAAVACDPLQREAIFLLADMESRMKSDAAEILFSKFLDISRPRYGDVVRDARSQHAHEFLKARREHQKKKMEKQK